MRRPSVGAATVALACAMAWVATALGAERAQDPQPTVREERSVIVNGVRETWQLVWLGQPSPVCGPDDIGMAITCPCSGLAYGESGRLVLVRRRAGREVERMELASLFGDEYPASAVASGAAYVQKWVLESGDFERDSKSDPTLLSDIRRRSQVTLMAFADYDGDGQASEFLLQVGTLPCGKHQMALIGVSSSNPHLHAFASAEEPAAPLVMGAWVWKSLLAGHGRTDAVEWPCGDHGSEVESRVQVSTRSRTIHVRRENRSCTEKEQSEAPFNAAPGP